MLGRLILLWGVLLVSIRAQDGGVIPAEELARAPGAARVSALIDRASSQGWGSVMPVLRTAAQQAYESGSGYAPAWYYLYRWSRLLATPYNRAIQDWIKAVEAAKAGHPNMAASYDSHPGSLAADLPRELLVTLLGSPAISEEFFHLLSPIDNPAAVLSILRKIHTQDSAQFAAYPNLALAIAVVYDVPPPPWWPHGQVNAAALPRQLPEPEKIFAYYVKLDRAHLTAQRLNRLPAAELKFLVDEVAPVSELDWARGSVTQGIAELGKVYDLVKYRRDRVTNNQYLWPSGPYTLQQVLAQGGICVDQAYFASMVGKAKGIPTILFRGAGLDGRHAWFGYLDANQRWQLDCGRYAEQKFVVGLAFDPQTWTDINDHELLFLTERFRALPTYKLSRMHGEFAADYLREGKVEQALKSAREAVNRDARNLEAWHTLIAAQTALNADPRAREAVLREAVLAFARYPDLEIYFSRELIDVLRKRGELSLASFEEQRLAKKYQSGREDLSIEQAANTVRRSMETDDLATQIKVFNRVLDTQGRGAAVDFYDKVVVPFVESLATHEQVPAALQCLARARRTLRVDPGKQLDLEIKELEGRLRTGQIAKKSVGT